MAKAGSVEIPVELQLKQFNKDLNEAEKELKGFDKEREKLERQKTKIDIDNSDLKKQLDDTKKELDKLEKFKSYQTQIISASDNKYGLTFMDKRLTELKAEEANLTEQIALTEQDVNKQLEDNNIKREKALKKINETKKKVQELKQEEEKAAKIEDIKAQLAEHEKSIGKVIKKVGKWALAVFGLRSAYMYVRQAANTIAQYDKKIGADLEYIRYALAFMLKPVIEWLVNAVYKILQYIGAIIYRLTGYNIFKFSGAKDFEKAIKSSEKSSKKIKDNFTAAFDEIDKLPSEDTTGGAGSSFTAPQYDLAKAIEDFELPKWLRDLIDFVKENKTEVLTALGLLLSIFTIAKGAQWIRDLSLLFSTASGTSGAIASAGASALWTAGAVAAIGVEIYKVESDKKKLVENTNKINEQGLKYNKEFVEQEKDIVKLNDDLNYRRQQGNKLLDKSEDMGIQLIGLNGQYLEGVKSTVLQEDNILQRQIEMYRNGELTDEQQKELIDNIKAQKSHLNEINDQLEIQGFDTEYVVDLNNQYTDVLGEMGVKVETFYDKLGWTFNKTKENKQETEGWSKVISDKVLGPMERIQNLKLEKKELDVDVNMKTESAKNRLSELLSALGRKASGLFDAIGMKDFAKDIFKKFSNIKLAQGGIVNNPGKGVPVGVVAGEAGSEAVIPLNDETMDRLGSAIARHMSVNLTNINQMNGRTISRELQKISNETDFTYNV